MSSQGSPDFWIKLIQQDTIFFPKYFQPSLGVQIFEITNTKMNYTYFKSRRKISGRKFTKVETFTKSARKNRGENFKSISAASFDVDLL